MFYLDLIYKMLLFSSYSTKYDKDTLVEQLVSLSYFVVNHSDVNMIAFIVDNGSHSFKEVLTVGE